MSLMSTIGRTKYKLQLNRNMRIIRKDNKTELKHNHANTFKQLRIRKTTFFNCVFEKKSLMHKDAFIKLLKTHCTAKYCNLNDCFLFEMI